MGFYSIFNATEVLERYEGWDQATSRDKVPLVWGAISVIYTPFFVTYTVFLAYKLFGRYTAS
jgi:hypothetical protein